MIYTVNKGDTIYGISKQFGVSIDDIKKANNLSNDNIYVGQTLVIPTDTSTYIVKKGDNLYSIANKYGITVDELKKANNLTSDLLSIGQTLIIPSNTSSNDTYIYYTVKKGDTLYSIANKYNTTVNNIKNINSLSTNIIAVGQTLKIPTSNTNIDQTINYTSYIVKKGDSLYSIAQKYGMTVDELKSINNLKSNLLQINQVLLVRTGPNNDNNEETEVKECYGSNYIEPTYITYVVKKGDNLYSIANKFNTSVDNIIKLNNLNNNTLQIGQILKIKEAE